MVIIPVSTFFPYTTLFRSGVTGDDIAGVLNGMDLSDLPTDGTVYSITNIGGGFANVYEAVPNADGTAASRITDTLRSEEHTSELQSRGHLVCRLLLETKHT